MKKLSSIWDTICGIFILLFGGLKCHRCRKRLFIWSDFKMFDVHSELVITLHLDCIPKGGLTRAQIPQMLDQSFVLPKQLIKDVKPKEDNDS